VPAGVVVGRSHEAVMVSIATQLFSLPLAGPRNAAKSFVGSKLRPLSSSSPFTRSAKPSVMTISVRP
jgi:hypothetical protein